MGSQPLLHPSVQPAQGSWLSLWDLGTRFSSAAQNHPHGPDFPLGLFPSPLCTAPALLLLPLSYSSPRLLLSPQCWQSNHQNVLFWDILLMDKMGGQEQLL